VGYALQTIAAVGIAHPTRLKILWLRHASYQKSNRSPIAPTKLTNNE